MGISVIAGGNVSPKRIVLISGVNSVTQSNATPGQQLFGVSTEQLRRPAGTAYDDGFAAISGEAILVYQVGDRCLCEMGTNSGSAGAQVKPDANGRGATATSGDYIVGTALESWTASNQQILLDVAPGKM